MGNSNQIETKPTKQIFKSSMIIEKPKEHKIKMESSEENNNKKSPSDSELVSEVYNKENINSNYSYDSENSSTYYIRHKFLNNNNDYDVIANNEIVNIGKLNISTILKAQDKLKQEESKILNKLKKQRLLAEVDSEINIPKQNNFNENEYIQTLPSANQDINDYYLLSEFLGKLSYMKDIVQDKKVLNYIISRMEYCVIEKDKELTREGADPIYFFFLKKGSIIETKGKQTIKTHRPPCFFGDLCILSQTYRHEGYLAKETSYLYLLEKSIFMDIIEEYNWKTYKDEKLRVLKESKIIKFLANREMASKITRMEFNYNDFLFLKDEYSLGIFIICEGEAELRKVANKFKMKNNDLIGIMYFFGWKIRTCDVAICSQVAIVYYISFFSLSEVLGPDYFRIFQNALIISQLENNKFFSYVATALNQNILDHFDIEISKEKTIVFHKDESINNTLNIIIQGDIIDSYKKSVLSIIGNVVLAEDVYKNNERRFTKDLIAKANFTIIAKIPRKRLLFLLGKSFEEIEESVKRKNFLKKIPAFCFMSESIINRIAEVSVFESFDENVEIYRNYNDNNKAIKSWKYCSIYFIVEGSANVNNLSEDKLKNSFSPKGKASQTEEIKEIITNNTKLTLTPKCSFGYDWLVRREDGFQNTNVADDYDQALYDIISIEKTTVLKINSIDWLKLFPKKLFIHNYLTDKLFLKDITHVSPEEFYVVSSSQAIKVKSKKSSASLTKNKQSIRKLSSMHEDKKSLKIDSCSNEDGFISCTSFKIPYKISFKIYSIVGLESPTIINDYNHMSEFSNNKNNISENPFIPQVISTILNDTYNVCIYQNYTGKDLYTILYEEEYTPSFDVVRFWAACLLINIKNLHQIYFLHRNIKPENITLLNGSGYLVLDKFEISTYLHNYSKCKTDSVKGTPHYMAPEIILNSSGYSFSVDYWSLGICLFEFVCKYFPFGDYASNPKEVYSSILNDEIIFPKDVTYIDYIMLIKGLLNKNTNKRLSSFEDIKNSDFFKNFDWESINNLMMEAPYINKTNQKLSFQGNVKILNLTEAMNLKLFNNLKKDHMSKKMIKYNK